MKTNTRFISLRRFFQKNKHSKNSKNNKNNTSEDDDVSSVCTSSTISTTLSSRSVYIYGSYSQGINTAVKKRSRSSSKCKRGGGCGGVSFNLDRNVIYTNKTGICKDDLKDLWYNPKERQQLKESSREDLKFILMSAAAAAAEQLQQQQQNETNNNYENDGNNDNPDNVDGEEIRNCPKIIEKLWDACHEDGVSKTTTSAVILDVLSIRERKYFCDMNDGLVVGLETRTSRKLAEERSYAREKYIKSVKDIQKVLCCSNNNNNNMMSYEEKAEYIRQACERISRPCVLFAQCIAETQIGEV